MKKIIAYLLVTLMCVSTLAGCGGEKVSEDLQAAADYVYAMYKDAGVVTAKDYERVTQVMIDNTAYTVEWTTDNEAVTVTVEDKIATINVDEKSAEEVAYVLTATVKDADGNSVKKEFKYTVPKFEGYESIVNDAYALESGASLEGTYTLEGVIVSVDTPYSDEYKNVTVTIQIGDLKDKPIMCFRLKDGEGVTAASTIKVGDTITVTGTLMNYNGTIEFDAGCTLDNVVVGDAPEVTIPTVPAGATMAEIVDIAYTLESGTQLTDNQTLTGVITSVDTEYSDEYQNVTVTIQVGDKADKPIMCYCMKGEGADTVKVGDTITVTGILKNYKGTIEFDAGCTLDAYTTGGSGEEPSSEEPSSETQSSEPVDTTPSTPEEIVKAAYELKAGAYLGGSKDKTWTLTGVVTKVKERYSEQYKNITVVIQVGDLKDNLIECYRLSGDKAAEITEGAKIKVTGAIKNYNGTIEFDSGCNLDEILEYGEASKDLEVPSGASQADIVNLAYTLSEGAALKGDVTLEGVITSVDTEYSDQYQNVTVTIQIGDLADKPIMCYRLKGDGADTIKVGDTIKVTGTIINYKGTIEFNSGCQLVTE